ncbi:MAG TPA: hypothetical protein PL002_01615, partial [Flavobacteriales bacterium]|nr:hypothetical protein [Flavobacteriales bacterium]
QEPPADHSELHHVEADTQDLNEDTDPEQRRTRTLIGAFHAIPDLRRHVLAMFDRSKPERTTT